MKKILNFILISLISIILCGCGISSEKIANTTIKQQQLVELYDSVASTVALLDEASVEMYDEIGKTVRKSIRAVTSDFEGYDNDDLDKLSIDMDSAILSLKSFVGKAPLDTQPDESADNVFSITVYNKTGRPLSKVMLKSGSGNFDTELKIGDIFTAEGIFNAKIKASDSENFNISAIDTEGNNIAFYGNFYISNVKKISLIYQDERYLIETSAE